MGSGNNSSVNFITKTAIVASLYAIVTWAFYFAGYNAIQFRVSEILVLLAFLDKRYCYGLVLGCIIANITSPYGIVDIIIGSLASLFVVVMIALTRKFLGFNRVSLYISSLWTSVSALIIAYGIVFIFGAPEGFWFWTTMVAAGEFVVVTIVGAPIFSWIITKPAILKRFSFDNNIDNTENIAD